jgi:hypothetical protein
MAMKSAVHSISAHASPLVHSHVVQPSKQSKRDVMVHVPLVASGPASWLQQAPSAALQSGTRSAQVVPASPASHWASQDVGTDIVEGLQSAAATQFVHVPFRPSQQGPLALAGQKSVVQTLPAVKVPPPVHAAAEATSLHVQLLVLQQAPAPVASCSSQAARFSILMYSVEPKANWSPVKAGT